MKTILISRSFPPRVSGSSTVLGNLFKHFPMDSYVVFKEEDSGPRDLSSRFDCKSYSFDPKPYNIYLGRILRSSLPYFLMLILTTRLLLVMKKERVTNILAVYPNPLFFISSFLVHKLAKLPLFVYMHDTWADAMGDGMRFHRFMAGIFERRIFCSASGIFVISESLQELYAKKYGIQSIVLLHCIDLPESLPNREHVCVCKKRQRTVRIVFTGDIYQTNIDAVRNMVDAMALLPDNCKLILCTPTDISSLKKNGIHERENVEIMFAETRKQVLSLQRYADILFLPLAFNSNVPLIELSTMFPTKTIEYMISGTPILVHAPSDYYLSEHARERKWGFVVDTPSPSSLRDAVLLMLTGAELRQELVQNAWRSAGIYDGASISKRLQGYLGISN